jgi:hypothetical protein
MRKILSVKSLVNLAWNLCMNNVRLVVLVIGNIGNIGNAERNNVLVVGNIGNIENIGRNNVLVIGKSVDLVVIGIVGNIARNNALVIGIVGNAEKSVDLVAIGIVENKLLVKIPVDVNVVLEKNLEGLAEKTMLWITTDLFLSLIANLRLYTNQVKTKHFPLPIQNLRRLTTFRCQHHLNIEEAIVVNQKTTTSFLERFVIFKDNLPSLN